jgi:hypothetical protein
VIGLWSAMGLIQDRMHLITVCRTESLKTQTEVEPLIHALMNLNPLARLLRLQLLEAELQLAAAISSYNYPEAARQSHEIRRIRKQQHELEDKQKNIIKLANTKLYAGTFSAYLKLQAAFQEIKNKDQDWAKVEFLQGNPTIPKLAVRREDQDLAPPYYEKDQFEKRQETAQSWTQTYNAKGFFKFTHKSQSQCHATLEAGTWLPKIRMDKPYWK